MSIELQQQLRLQQDDLREAVEDLTGWLTDMEKTEAVARKQTLPIQPELPPVRGTCAPESNLAQPSSSVSIPAEDPLLLYKDRGNAFFKAGKYKEAIEQYTRGIGYDPRGKDAHILYGNRSMAYLNLSMLQEAEMDASMSTELNRTYTKGYYRRGMARHRLGKVQEALQDYERVLVLEPTNQEAKQAVQEVRSHLVSVTSQTSENNATQAIRRRKLVVEEVEEEEEEEEEVKDSSKLGSAPRVVPLPVTTSSAAKSTPAVTPPDVKLTQSQIDAQRRCEEAFRELEKTKQGNRSIHEPMSSTHHTARSNPRVQEICDEPHATDPSPCLKNEKVVSKHRDVNENLEEGPQQSMKERGGKVAQTTLPPSPQTDTKSKKTLASRIFELPPLTKAQLSIPPRNILEYDKMLSEITQSCPVKRPDASGTTEAEWVKQHQRELFAHYFRNLLPETYATFFRSNLSSITIERVLDALRYDYAINDASYAVRVLKGLLKIPRFDDMLMFCEAQEKETIQWIFDTVMSQVKGEKEEEMVQQLRSSYMELLGGIP